MAKVVLGLLAAFLATVLAARVSFFVSTSPDDAIADEPWSQNEMEFVAWNGERWTAWIRDGAFEHTPENPDRWSRHSNSSLAFIGWEGEAEKERGHCLRTDEILVAVDTEYYRPTEVDFLLGDPRNAQERLAWKHTVGFDALVAEMVETDRTDLRLRRYSNA